VVTLGESSVHGTHYLAEEAFSAVLEARLNDQEHGKRVEVINAGVGGALSDEIVHYARQSYVLEPDLLIMYFGNNDLADMMRLAEFRAWSPASIATRFVLDRIRLVRLISMLLPERALARIIPGGAWLDDGILGVEDSKLLRMLSELNLRVNMERIVRHAQREGVPVVLALQGQNDDMCGATKEDDPSFHSGCFQEALRRVAHKVGARTGVPVVDVPQALRFHAAARASEAKEQDESHNFDEFQPRRQGAGFSLFYDTCHPTRLGHRLIAETLVPTVERVLDR
jgi:lysophospholipase L1-like esterase